MAVEQKYEYRPSPVVLNRIPVFALEGAIPNTPYDRKKRSRAILVLVGCGVDRSVELRGQFLCREIDVEWAREYYPALFKEPKGGWKVIARGVMSGGSK